MSEKDGGDATPQNAQDLTVFVQSLLEQMVRSWYQRTLSLSLFSYYIGISHLPFFNPPYFLLVLCQKIFFSLLIFLNEKLN